MQIVIILIPLVLIVVALGVILFSWAVKSGQYDDLEGPAHRILYDDDADMIPDDARPDDQSGHTPSASPARDRDGAGQKQEPPQPQ